MLRILACLGLVKLVWLRDFQGEVYLTIKRKNPFGEWAHVYPLTFTGHVTLLPEGKCGGKSSYIVEWRED